MAKHPALNRKNRVRFSAVPPIFDQIAVRHELELRPIGIRHLAFNQALVGSIPTGSTNNMHA
jgi:hypothetical protein